MHYTLVGGAGIAASAAAGGTSDVPLTPTGVLARNSSFRFEPVLAGPYGLFSDTLMQTADQADAVPLPTGSYVDAEAFLSSQVLCAATPSCDEGFRNQYWDGLDNVVWGDYAVPVETCRTPPRRRRRTPTRSSGILSPRRRTP